MLRAVGFLLLAVGFFSVFQNNSLRTVSPGWFEPYQRESEALVISAMIDPAGGGKSGLGLGTYGYGMPGWMQRTYDAFEKGETPAVGMHAYVPQLGLQGHAFRWLAAWTKSRSLSTYQSLNSAALALLMALFVAWAVSELGWRAGLLLGATIACSPWLVSIARNLYWMAWTWYLPMVAVGAVLWRQGREGVFRQSPWLAAMFGTVALKSACGYEFLTAVVIAAFVPIVYFGIRNARPSSRIAGDVVLAGVASIAGFLAALFAHALARPEGFLAALKGIAWDAARRTHGGMDNVPANLLESLKASPWEVLLRYFLPTYQPLVAFPHVHAIALLGAMSCAAAWAGRSEVPRIRALGYAFFVAFLAPISWFIAAKGHSYIHLHVNFVLWSLPTLLIGSLCFGVLWAHLARKGLPLPGGADAAPGRARPSGAAIGRLGLVALLVVIVFRLFLSSDRDILALNAPYDEHWYVASALRGIWGGDYDRMVFANLPTYSAWILVIHGLGIPGRLAIDVAWMAAAGYLAVALRTLTARVWVALAAFTILVFHPWSFTLFDRALPETLMTVMAALAIAGLIEFWNCRNERETGMRRKVALVAISVGFAGTCHMTRAGMLALLPLLALGAWVLVRRRTSPDRGAQGALIWLILPLASTALLAALLVAANGWRWGIAARSELSAPGYERALQALHAIDPETRTPRYVAVTRRALELAYSASPTFAQLRSFYEGAPGASVAEHSRQVVGAAGETGNELFNWALREAGTAAGWRVSAAAADARYAAVADELERAFEERRLPHRTVGPSWMDPDAAKWRGDVLGSALKAMRLLVAPERFQVASPPEDASAKQLEEFTRAFGRRRLPAQAVLAGWIKVPEGSAVALVDDGRKVEWTKLEGPHRPDVPGGYPFRLVSAAGESPRALGIRLADDSLHKVPLESLKIGQIFRIDTIANGYLGVDNLALGASARRISAERLGELARMWSDIGALLAVFGAIGLVRAMMARPMRGTATVAVATLSLIACMIVVGFVGLIDASWWTSLQDRYIFPATPAFVTFGLLGMCLIFASRSTMRDSSPD
jgi:hypothetical protein